MEIWFKQKTRPRMNRIDCENHLKKSDPKNLKSQSEFAACEKITSKKANFCSYTVFSL